MGTPISQASDLADLQAIGLAHHQSGRLARAEACYRKILAADPAHVAAWHLLGVLAHQRGQPEAAVELISRAIAYNDGLPELHNNLGNALHAVGRSAQAEAAYRRALALKPDHVAAQNNLGVTLMEQGKPAEAGTCFRATLALRPDHPDAHSNLGNALFVQGRPAEAEACCRRALALRPDHAFALNNLGNALKDQGRSDEAEACYRRTIELRPEFAEAHNNLGLALEDQGQRAEAEHCYRRALGLKPDYPDACVNLGGVLLDHGDVAQAVEIVQHGLGLGETGELKALFTRCLRRAGSVAVASGAALRAYLLRALTEPWGRPSDLATYAALTVKQADALGECIARANAAWPRRISAAELLGSADWATVSDDLLIALLESSPVCDLELERFLTSLRCAVLDTAAADSDPGASDWSILRLACALARQCFINEYVFGITDEEHEQASRLRQALVVGLASDGAVPALWLAAVAAYMPLCSLPAAPSILDRAWPDALNALLAQQIREPLEGLHARQSIPRLTPIVDEVSLRVQEQYEENPYPRWVSTASLAKPSTVDVYLRRQLPLAAFRPLGKTDGIEILIAGCGTGQHSIETARRFPAAEVLAIDLSLSSLCYARRKSRSLGLSNLHYAQADILRLGSIDRRFDLIEASGVLHHLADPLVGWHVLVGILRPGGIMRVGLYSELARSRIISVQAFIAANGYGDTADDIRRFRQDLMQVESETASKLAAECRDFFTTSECRDLLFHRQEHRFSLPAIKTFLTECGLDFLGFDVEGRVLQHFRQRFPERAALADLDRWHLFETENPRTFTGMYQFYVQKR